MLRRAGSEKSSDGTSDSVGLLNGVRLQSAQDESTDVVVRSADSFNQLRTIQRAVDDSFSRLRWGKPFRSSEQTTYSVILPQANALSHPTEQQVPSTQEGSTKFAGRPDNSLSQTVTGQSNLPITDLSFIFQQGSERCSEELGQRNHRMGQPSR